MGHSRDSVLLGWEQCMDVPMIIYISDKFSLMYSMQNDHPSHLIEQ